MPPLNARLNEKRIRGSLEGLLRNGGHADDLEFRAVVDEKLQTLFPPFAEDDLSQERHVSEACHN